jgi:hypothetical protein
MLRGFRSAAVAVGMIGLTALTGCAETTYPTLPSLGGSGGNLLTKEQQQKTITDMQTEQATHGAEAAREIEGHK